MNSVLVLGGYGGFGARLCRRLSEDGWRVLVAGRNGEAARRAAASLANAAPLVADRNGDLAGLLREHRPLLLIDAAGPFQGSDYRVPEACIAQGVHYLDLADARDFVCGIGGLDEQARSRGVVVITGASSVPALSGAVVAEITRDFEPVASIAMSISASNRAAAGASVAAAILSYVGKPVRLWDGLAWQEATGWQKLRREVYAVRGQPPMRRLVALADVPDHTLLPERVPGRPQTIFRAGPEFAFQLLALWLVSWPVKWGWLASASGLGRWLRPMQRLTARLGSVRSAMTIEAKGLRRGEPLVRRWTLIADKGDGPEIPTMAAQLLARDLLAGRLQPGARNAGGLVALGTFRALFARLAIVDEVAERPYRPLYGRVMGERFETLPGPVRAMHQVIGSVAAAGVATVTRGRSPLARLVAAILRFPPAGTHALRVTFAEADGRERWTRRFSDHRFASEMHGAEGRLVERFCPLRFFFQLPSTVEGLEMVMVKWTAFGVPLPLMLAPRSRAREWAEGDDFRFDVSIALPLAGDVVRYTGWLRRE